MLAFVHIEKASGTTVIDTLRRSFGPRHCDTIPVGRSVTTLSPDGLRFILKIYPKLESIAGHIVKPYVPLETVRPEIRFFTFLREPIARTISHYQYQINRMRKSIPFSEWIKVEKYRDFQTKKLAGKADLKAAKEILRGKMLFAGLLDHFDESLLILRQRSGIPEYDPHYRRKNVAGNTRIRDELLGDSAMVELLKEANRVDLELYEYVSEVLYPEYRKGCGSGLDSDLTRFRAENDDLHGGWNTARNLLKRNLLYKPACLLAGSFQKVDSTA